MKSDRKFLYLILNEFFQVLHQASSLPLLLTNLLSTVKKGIQKYTGIRYTLTTLLSTVKEGCQTYTVIKYTPQAGLIQC